MKNPIVAMLLLFAGYTVEAQNYSELKKISLKDSLECKAAETKVLECSNYLLSKSCEEDLKSINATQFLLEWMGATPDYSFGLDDDLYKSIQSDLMLASRYLASQCKIAIADRPKEYDINFQLKFVTLFLDYCEEPKNNVKLNSKIKKLIEAKREGKLKEALAG